MELNILNMQNKLNIELFIRKSKNYYVFKIGEYRISMKKCAKFENFLLRYCFTSQNYARIKKPKRSIPWKRSANCTSNVA